MRLGTTEGGQPEAARAEGAEPRAPALLCVGALTLDTIFRLKQLPSASGKYLPSEVVRVAAGMASSAAIGASRQGGRVSLWASVGDDAEGDDLVRQLEREGVDCALVRRVAGGRTAIASILVDARGERIVVPFYDPVTQADPDAVAPGLSGYDAVLADPRWPGAAALALRQARARGIPAVLDADVAPPGCLERLLPLASHIVASLPAARALLGPGASPQAAVAELSTRHGVFVAVTDGDRGTWFRAPADGDASHAPAPRVEVVDTLAAGDVYHGAFALGMAEGWGEARAIEVASASAALKCRRFGGWLGAPTRREVLDFIEERRRGHPGV